MKEYNTTIRRAGIAAIDPEFDYYTKELSQDSIDLGWLAGLARAEENEKRKSRYNKYDDNEKYAHTNAENDGLGVVFEVAVTESLGFNPRDPEVLTLFHSWPYPADKPDVAGIYECRRLNKWDGEIAFWPKDVEANAIVIGGIVDHECVKGSVKATGTVTLLGWNYPVLDQEFAGPVCADGGRRIKRCRMRPLHTLPLLAGAQRLTVPVGEAA